MPHASAQINSGTLTATLSGLSNGNTVVLEISHDLINWGPVQTNVVNGTLLAISFPINSASGETLLRAVVR